MEQEEQEERPEQFFSPGGEQTTQETSSQSQAAPAPPSQEGRGGGGKTTKKTSPCIMCGKECTRGTIQCTICTMWCHMACTKLSKEALKGLEVQAKEVGQAYWACRSCMSFNNKWNAHMKETSRRQEETDSKVEDNKRNIDELRNLLEATRREMRTQASMVDGIADRMERVMEEELREREARRLNLVLHGVPEPGPEIKNSIDRMEMDREECERIFKGMKARTRKQQIRFCRRVGERGQGPRPMVIGLYSEEVKRHLLERSRDLRHTMYEVVLIVPDLTKSQRKGEQQLREEADRRNQELSNEDRERNLKWIVVGSRGEKRLIKGTEREEQGSSQEDARRRGEGQRGGRGGGGSITGGRGGLTENEPRREEMERGNDHNSGTTGTGTDGATDTVEIVAGRNEQGGSNPNITTGGLRGSLGGSENSGRAEGYGLGRNGGTRREEQGNSYSGNSNYNGNSYGSGSYNGNGNGNYNGNGNSYGNGSYNGNGNGNYNGNGNGNYNGNGNSNGYGSYNGNNSGNCNGNSGGNYNGQNRYNNGAGNGNGYGRGRGNYENGYQYAGNNSRGGGTNSYLPPTRNRGREWRPGNEERPWQETGARRKEGTNNPENPQDREQQRTQRTATEEVEWEAGDLPEPIGKSRERANSKRNRSWEEDGDPSSRRQRF